MIRAYWCMLRSGDNYGGPKRIRQYPDKIRNPIVDPDPMN